LAGDEEAGRIEWPTLAVFKEEDSGRTGSEARALPEPRLNIVSHETLIKYGGQAINDDGTIPWKHRELLHTKGMVLLPLVGETEAWTEGQMMAFGEPKGEEPVDEMRLREMPEHLQDMLLWLYESGGDAVDDDLDK
jgi:hypothetical protein